MLKSLHISNYALIEAIDIDFVSGLNIITGETGAGKSIMLGALSLILGARADLGVVRDHNKKTVVEAEFDICALQNINDILKNNDIDENSDLCILRREITARGGSRAFINDTPVNLPLMRQIAVRLIDIHSQHQNLLIADSAYQLSIIDSLAHNEERLKAYIAAFEEYRKILKVYTTTRDMLNRSRADAEYISYQLEQIDALNLVPGEQESLERERNLLANATTIKTHITNAINLLSHPTEITASLMRSADEVSNLDDVYDDAMSLASRLRSAQIEIADILDTLIDYDADLTADPAQLEHIEERLSAIYSLETRHHVDNSDALIELREKLRAQLDTINNGDDHLAQLEAEARNAKKHAVILARELSECRIKTAKSFADRLIERAKPLGLDNIRCDIKLTQTKLTATGIDEVDFLFAFNKNQELMSVGKTASGGEISRVMLAIKSLISEIMSLPTIVFDEVDTGVSGDIANRMGREMVSISTHTQVITITHLAQVAARGERHFKVFKTDDEIKTTTNIVQLSDEERVSEIAMMISGDASNTGAINTARQMLGK